MTGAGATGAKAVATELSYWNYVEESNETLAPLDIVRTRQLQYQHFVQRRQREKSKLSRLSRPETSPP